MRKTIQLICIAILFFPVVLLSQPNLLGLTYSGGQGVGAVVKYQRTTNTLNAVCSFPYVAGGPSGSLVMANNGKYYGVTNNGGTSGAGVIFSFDKATNTRTDVFNFNTTKGANPNAGMIKASNGKLYGMTSKGGLNSVGVLYSFNTTTNVLTVLYNFDGLNGSEPMGELMQASNGKIYGLTSTGGSIANKGALFVFDPVAITYQKLYAFSGLDGSYPQGGLTQYNDSTLYGLTTDGGHLHGTIFSFDITSNTLVIVSDFNPNATGTYPNGSLLKASNGKLYGTTSYGGAYGGFNGTLFSFDPATSTKVKLFDFNNAVSVQGEPYQTIASLVQGTNGKLYGLTTAGGINPTYQGGSIFSFDLTNNTAAFTFPFSAAGGIDGKQPNGSLVQDANGKFYGTTSQGGSPLGWGAIYSFDPATTTYSKLNAFTTNTGMLPVGGLVLADNGKYYGMTQTGGSNNTGTIFSFDSVTNIQTNVLDFTGANGANPSSSLMKASNSKLYGMTTTGGTFNNGTLFSFDPLTNTHIKLLDLNGPVCEQPQTGLIEASNGKLYGASTVSFPNPPGYDTIAGVIFSYDILTNTATNLFNMSRVNGTDPKGLVQATNGKLYGMSTHGGTSINSDGIIFSFDPVNNTFSRLFDFDSINGSYPQSDFIQASNGKLYGLAPYGGSKNCGTLFSLDPSNNAFVKLYDFDSINGRVPFGKLMQASDGKLYGMTTRGGNLDNGVVFSYDITNATYTKLKEFTGPNGAKPNTGNYLTEQNTCAIIPPVIAGGGKLKNCNGTAVTLSTNKVGNAISLSSANNKYINVPHSASINISAGTAFTIEAWINVTDNVNNTIVDKGDYDFLFQTHSNGNTGLGFYNRNTGWIYSAGTVPLNQWVHVAVTYSNQTIKFYQNGVLQGTNTTPAITLGDTGPMTIGRQQPAACACNNLDGSMDELRLWNVARTQAEIQANRSKNVPANSAGLVAYYKFDDNAGPVVKDATANANNGTLVNDPTWIVPSTSPVSAYSSYLWSNGATTASISASTSATYTVTVSNVNGCTASSSAIAIRGTTPTVTITPSSATVCTPYTTLTLTASSSPATYTWKPAASLNTTTGSSVTASLTVNTTYTVTATNTDGCTATKTAKILKDPTPTNLTTTNVGTTVATANWDLISCANSYVVDYKQSSSATWSTIQVFGNNNFKQLTGLLPSTAYNWRVRASFAPGTQSAYTNPVNFTTLTLREGELPSNENLILYPNPSSGSITLQLTACENCTCILNVYDVLGQLVFTETRKAGGNTGTYDLSKLPKGVYQVRVSYNESNQYCKLVLQ